MIPNGWFSFLCKFLSSLSIILWGMFMLLSPRARSPLVSAERKEGIMRLIASVDEEEEEEEDADDEECFSPPNAVAACGVLILGFLAVAGKVKVKATVIMKAP